MWLSTGPFKLPNTSTQSREKPTSKSASLQTSPLTEALRKNPFRTVSQGQPSTKEENGNETKALNDDLFKLANCFPDIKLEVLREILTRFNGDSRLSICTEQLLRYRAEWVRGRVNVPPRDSDESISIEEQFRTEEYIAATRNILVLEFRALSRSAIEAVLAEVNFSYSNARPILQGLANRTWRITITNLFKKKKALDEIPSSLSERARTQSERPRLLSTGSAELDQELENVFIVPVQLRQFKHQISADLELAQKLNDEEAEKSGSTFECQICYDDVAFESIASCTGDGHIICLSCVRNALHESVFGQGWAKSIDTRVGSLKCIAASTDEECYGHVPQEMVKRALGEDKAGKESWSKFNERLAEDALFRSSLPIVRCSFCSYAEADRIYNFSSTQHPQWRLKRPTDLNTFSLILVLELLPSLFLLLIPLLILFPGWVKGVFYTSLANLAYKTSTKQFNCRNPSCLRKSCLKCSKAWHDPHICHEPLILSLRTTVEAARTAAVKRTCPRCGTCFVKSSGCNKLTCVCGYSMCYLCRKNIGKTGENEGAEGYRHFCEHFRPIPGQKCSECEKCDLYRAEDEDLMVKSAGEAAEKEWREREGMIGVKGLENVTGNMTGEHTVWSEFWNGNWTLQSCSDRFIERFVIVTIM